MDRCCKWLAVWLLLPLFLPAISAGKSYYVSPGGVDSRPCDLPGAPCHTVSRALERAGAESGHHTVHIAARHGGRQAVYRESIHLRRGVNHQPKIVLDGSWRGDNGQRALIAPRGSGTRQAVLLDLAGAELRNTDIDARGLGGAVAGLVLDNPGAGHRVRGVRVTTGPGQVGVVVNSPSARLRLVEAASNGAPALVYSALGEPVLVEDAVMLQTGNGAAVRGSGLSSLIFRRSMAFAPPQSPWVIGTEGGRLFLDSALVSGGGNGAIHLGGATGPSLRAVSSTVDSGVAGIADPGLAAVTLATGGNAEVDLIGSILLEPPLITVAGGAVIRCQHSDVPSTVVEQHSPPQTIACGAGQDGNSHHTPDRLFAGVAPFDGPAEYGLRPGSPAINTGPQPAPPDATAYDLLGQARIQPPGTCAESEDVIDKGALEFGCTPTPGAPRPPGLFDRGDRRGIGAGSWRAPPDGGKVRERSRPRPVIRRQRAMSRRVARRHKVRIVFRLNTASRVVASVAGAKLRRARKRARRGRNVMVIPTRRLKVRRRAYRVKLVARSRGGTSRPRWLRFRIVSPRR